MHMFANRSANIDQASSGNEGVSGSWKVYKEVWSVSKSWWLFLQRKFCICCFPSPPTLGPGTIILHLGYCQGHQTGPPAPALTSPQLFSTEQSERCFQTQKPDMSFPHPKPSQRRRQNPTVPCLALPPCSLFSFIPSSSFFWISAPVSSISLLSPKLTRYVSVSGPLCLLFPLSEMLCL